MDNNVIETNQETGQIDASHLLYDWVHNYTSTKSFPLDDFQLDALRIIGENKNVLVGAPTGAGKTVVGDGAIYYYITHLDQSSDNGETNSRVYYTTPIKALSNQKYNELVDKYGTEKVGLITGDNKINPNARIIVMTTEVLRNQVYANSEELNTLKCVIMDEIHFLGDKSRGSVWEEILISLPEHVRIVGLSATVSNIEEFASWLKIVRGNCDIILTEHRPIPLISHVAVSAIREKGVDYRERVNSARIFDIYQDKSLNGKLLSIMSRESGEKIKRRNDRKLDRMKNRSGHNKKGRSTPNLNKSKGMRFTPRVEEVLSGLQDMDILPAIYFVFSRQKCELNMNYVTSSHLTLVNDSEKNSIHQHIDQFFEERQIANHYEIFTKLGYEKLYDGILKGVAYHHAGLVPVIKELIEYLFGLGLVKCVFATETLALGVNMPARSVVIDSLIKFDGQKFGKISPGLFTQLTGRAGRRGLDEIGHAIVVDETKFGLPEVASLASNRIYPLLSAFEPNYNMCANYSPLNNAEYIEHIINSSFAQYQISLKNERSHDLIAKYDKEIQWLDNKLKNDKLTDKELNRTRRKQSIAHSKLENIRREVKNSTTKLSKKYYNCQKILLKLGFLNDTNGNITLTNKGEVLQTLYCENVLILIEIIFSDILLKLNPGEIIALLSLFVSVSRGSQMPELHRLEPINSALGETRINEAYENVNKITDSVRNVQRKLNNLDESEIINYGMSIPAYLIGQNMPLYDVLHPRKCVSNMLEAQLHKDGSRLESAIKALPTQLNIGDLSRMVGGVYDLMNQIIRILEMDYDHQLLDTDTKTTIITKFDNARAIIKWHEIYDLLYIS